MNRIILKGDIPSPTNPPRGCKFHTRCNNCMEICKSIEPKFIEVEKDHFVKCHLFDGKGIESSSEDAKELNEKA